MYRNRDPKSHYPEYQFGDLVRGWFPHEQHKNQSTSFAPKRDDAASGSHRWMFVLKDLGRRVLVIYMTSNSELKCHKAYRLGMLPDNRVSNIVPERWEILDKSRLSYWLGCERVEFGHVLKYIGWEAKHGRYDGYSEDVLVAVLREEWRQQKRLAKQNDERKQASPATKRQAPALQLRAL